MSTTPFRVQYPIRYEYNVFAFNEFNAHRDYSFFSRPVKHLHEGIDFIPTATAKANNDLEIYAAQRGVVTRVAFQGSGYGHYCRIEHKWGDETYVTWYAHMKDKPFVKENQVVTTNTVLGITGNTGFSTAAHLHFTLQRIGGGLKGYAVDDVVPPRDYLVERLDDFDELKWVDDVTIPDGMLILAGTSFPKTWKVRNTGNTVWNGYKLKHVADDRMGAPETVDIPTTQPGQEVDITVSLTAPTTSGKHESTWQAQNAKGELFPSKLFVEINAVTLKNNAAFVEHVNVPEGKIIPSRTKFTKTWKIRNTGQTTWGQGYQLIRIDGDAMGTPRVVNLPPLAPNEEGTVSVDMVAPVEHGRYRATWGFHTPDGLTFGENLWVSINVIESTTKPLAELVGSNFVVTVGSRVHYRWQLKNTGGSAWGDGYTIQTNAASSTHDIVPFPLPKLASEATEDVSVKWRAPTVAGEHQLTLELKDDKGERFGPSLTIIYTVEDKAI